MLLKFNLTSKHAFRLLMGLLCIEVIFCIIYFTDFILNEPNWRIHTLFNLDGETNITAWFSSIQLFMIGLIALLTAQNQYYKAPPSKKGLTIFGLGFMYLSMDEGASIHEKITLEFHNNPLVPYFDGVHGIWIVVYGAIGIVVSIILWRDIWAIFKHYRPESLIFLFGIIIYLAGTAGAETITYFFIDKTNALVYTLEVILEEFLEMLGASILLYTVLLISLKKTDHENLGTDTKNFI